MEDDMKAMLDRPLRVLILGGVGPSWSLLSSSLYGVTRAGTPVEFLHYQRSRDMKYYQESNEWFERLMSLTNPVGEGEKVDAVIVAHESEETLRQLGRVHPLRILQAVIYWPYEPSPSYRTAYEEVGCYDIRRRWSGLGRWLDDLEQELLLPYQDCKKALLVEDDESMILEWKQGLEPLGIECIVAVSMEEAYGAFGLHRESLDLVVLDGSLTFGSGYPETRHLAVHMRTKGRYAGPMIAASSDANYRKEQIEAGCDFESSKKSQVPDLVREIFNL